MNNNVMFMAGCLSVCLLLPGLVTAETSKVYPDSVKQLVAQAKKSIKTIDMRRFKAALDAHEYDMIIDVREPGEFAKGYIPGAINIPRGVIEFKIWPYVGYPDKMNSGKKIILYCKTGGRCSLAAKSLQDLGFTNVMSVDMMFKDWLKAGYPVEVTD
jgi:rhodanese-related sulfurtransferase